MASQMDAVFKGHVGADPTLHIARNGTAITALRVAHTMSRRLPNGDYDDETQWFDVKCFGRLAQNVASCVAKGHPLLIRGRVVTETWQGPEGEPRSKVVVIASDIGIDLTFGTASYTRAAQRPTPAAQPAEISAPKPPSPAQDAKLRSADDSQQRSGESGHEQRRVPPPVPTPKRHHRDRDELARNRFAQYATFS